MSKEPQPRDEHGHFKSSNHSCNCKQDISLRDVTEVIRALDDFKSPQPSVKKEIVITEPVGLHVGFDDSIGMDIYHHSDYNFEEAFVKVAAGVLFVVLACAAVIWMLTKLWG